MSDVPLCYSPSQIQTFLDCERKWGWQYLEDLPPVPPTPAQELGTDTHLQLEEYVGLGNSLDYTRPSGLIAEAALEYINQWIPFVPCPKPEFATEREFIIISPQHRYYGLIDLSSITHGWVADYKTSSNPSRYAKTSEDLKQNVQAVIYATNLLIDRPDLDEVELRWLYLPTKGRKKAIPVVVQMSRDEVGTMFAAIEGIADLMDSHQGKRALDLLPNPRMCEAFGGCPHREKCNLSPIQKLRSIMSADTKTDGLLDLLLKKQNETVATSGINPPEAVKAPPETEASDNGAELATTLAQEPPAEAATPKRTRKTKADVVASTRPIGTLYVDCMPMGSAEKIYAFADLVASAREVIAATEFKGQKGPYKVSDYRLMEFGQGPAVLLASIEQVITNSGRLESIYVQANTPEASICLAYLQSQADRVVLGTR